MLRLLDQDGDSLHFYNIDLKTSEFPWIPEECVGYLHVGGQIVGWCENKTPVGFAAFRYAEKSSMIYLAKLGVLPSHRGRGISRALLEYVEALTVTVTCFVPEYQVLSTEMTPVPWLKHMGFRYNGGTVELETEEYNLGMIKMYEFNKRVK